MYAVIAEGIHYNININKHCVFAVQFEFISISYFAIE